MIKPTVRFWFALTFSATTFSILSACGGGGSGDSSPGTSQPPVAPAAYVSPQNLTNAEVLAIAGKVFSLVNYMGVNDQIAKQLYNFGVSASTDQGSEACSLGGTVSFSRVDADGSRTPSKGDRATLTAQACRFPSQLAGLAQSGEARLDGVVTGEIDWVMSGTFAVYQRYQSLTSAIQGQSLTLDGTIHNQTGSGQGVQKFDNFSVKNPVTGLQLIVASGEGEIGSSSARFNVTMDAPLSVTAKVKAAAGLQGLNRVSFGTDGKLKKSLFEEVTVTLFDGVAPHFKSELSIFVIEDDQIRINYYKEVGRKAVDSSQTVTTSALLAAGKL